MYIQWFKVTKVIKLQTVHLRIVSVAAIWLFIDFISFNIDYLLVIIKVIVDDLLHSKLLKKPLVNQPIKTTFLLKQVKHKTGIHNSDKSAVDPPF